MNLRSFNFDLYKYTKPKGFAALTSSDLDKNMTRYRCFDALSARNLIFYQAELAELDDLQQQYDEEDRKARAEASIVCQRDLASFAQSALEDGRDHRK